MNELFRVEFISSLDDEKYVRERYIYYIKHRPANIILLLFFILGIVELVLTLSVGANINWVLLYFGYFLLIVIIDIYRYRKTVKRWKAQRLEVYGDRDVPITMTISSDGITQSTPELAEMTLSLDKFEKMLITKNLIILRTKARLFVSLRKDSFTVGTPEEFIQFMRQKGVKIR